MQCPKVISKGVRATRSDCTSQAPRRAVRITRLLFGIPICAFVTGGSSEIRRKIFRKSTKMKPKSMENRCNIDLGRFWALKAVSETHRDAFRIDPGRQKKAAGPILEHLGRANPAKSTWEPAKSLPGPVLGQSRTILERSPSALGALSAVECARGTILCCFGRVAQKLEA